MDEDRLEILMKYFNPEDIKPMKQMSSEEKRKIRIDNKRYKDAFERSEEYVKQETRKYGGSSLPRPKCPYCSSTLSNKRLRDNNLLVKNRIRKNQH